MTLMLVNTHFTDTLNFRTYCLVNQSQKYDWLISGKIGNCAKHMDVQTSFSLFKPLDHIFVLVIFHSFTTACDSNAKHESSAMVLFQNFM